MTAYLACAIAEGFGEGEDATEAQIVEAWQYLHTTGLAYTLQGWYGRTAQHLLSVGIIKDNLGKNPSSTTKNDNPCV